MDKDLKMIGDLKTNTLYVFGKGVTTVIQEPDASDRFPFERPSSSGSKDKNK